jgi:hypothetical protein
MKEIDDRADELCRKISEEIGDSTVVRPKTTTSSSGGCWDVYRSLCYSPGKIALSVDFRLVRRRGYILIKSITVHSEDDKTFVKEYNTSGQVMDLDKDHHPINRLIRLLKKRQAFDYLFSPEAIIWNEVVKEALGQIKPIIAADSPEELKLKKTTYTYSEERYKLSFETAEPVYTLVKNIVIYLGKDTRQIHVRNERSSNEQSEVVTLLSDDPVVDIVKAIKRVIAKTGERYLDKIAKTAVLVEEAMKLVKE